MINENELQTMESMRRGIDLIRLVSQADFAPPHSTDYRYVLLLTNRALDMTSTVETSRTVQNSLPEPPETASRGARYFPEWLKGAVPAGVPDQTGTITEFLGDCGLEHAEVFYDGRYIVLLFGPEHSFLERYLSVAQNLIRKLQSFWGQQTAFVLSPITDDPQKLHQIYRVADLKFGLAEFCGESPQLILGGYEKDERAASKDPALHDSERRLYLKLVNLDFPGAEACLIELIQAIGQPYYSDVPLLKARLFCILEMAAYYLAFQSGNDREMQEQMPLYMGSFLGAETAEELLLLGKKYISLIEGHFGNSNDRISAAMTKILGYFSDHYMNSSINVSAIARHFGISPQQFSRDFRKYTGTSPSRYLHRIRTERAEQLLLNTSLSNEQIADRVGFASVKGLYRAIQDAEGVTPSQFRKHQQLGEK